MRKILIGRTGFLISGFLKLQRDAPENLLLQTEIFKILSLALSSDPIVCKAQSKNFKTMGLVNNARDSVFDVLKWEKDNNSNSGNNESNLDSSDGGTDNLKNDNNNNCRDPVELSSLIISEGTFLSYLLLIL